MSYSLRPENKLKVPKRFRETEGGEAEDPPESKTTNPDTVGSLPPPISVVPRTFGAQHSTFPDAPEQPKMANIKIIKQKKRMRTDEPEEYDSPVRTRAGRAVKIPKDTALELPPDKLSLKPAAFPSLPTNIMPPLPTAVGEFEGHGMKELVEAMEKEDLERVSAINTHFAQMYATSTNAWYAELRERWSPSESDTTIKFESLWPSLRQIIIDQILQDVAGVGHTDTFHPVQRLLKITRTELFDIIEKNSRVWDTEEDIPLYYRKLKRENPDAIIDPDQPPPAQVVRAIKFLKQEHLPGDLLGKWSTLPSVQVFTEYPEVERYHGDIDTVVKCHESSEAIVEQQEREHEARLEEMIRLGNIASREVRPKDRVCDFCHKKGHLDSDYDREGLLLCPAKRLAAYQKRSCITEMHADFDAEVARRYEAAEVELAEIRRKDRIAAAQPTQSAQPQQPPISGPNSPRTNRIYQSWKNWKVWNATMTNPAFQGHTGSRWIRKQTREQYAEELWRQGDKHPGLKVNQPYYVEIIEGLKAAKERLQNGGAQTKGYSNISITSASASAPTRRTVSLAQIESADFWTPPLERLRPPPPPAYRTTEAPITNASAAMLTPTSLPSTSPRHQSQGQPQIRKKRGPYKKKIKPVAGTFTSPPPPRSLQKISRNGLVSLAPPGVSHGMTDSAASDSPRNGYSGGGNGYTTTRDENEYATTSGENGDRNAQENAYTTIRVENEYTNRIGHANTPGNGYTNGYTRASEVASSDTTVFPGPGSAPPLFQTQLPTPPTAATTLSSAKAYPIDENAIDTHTL
ncbi:hypothetical protein PTT_10951 [Pyrenophora teres f. teres 0-1]|uniref:Uncharacterized protein n=2 Tax=Pyrenophora teres f. teres TaxID=97479 RepID=E3RQF8_PYRTT|nr:hypothetical protein PTT_10951 [Pyrenophora teres f. teres 0-1]KAE8847787.1 hypothetical protein PTNB85_01630 [Pyrenophora teres f. teres]KAE8854056.1 hypothetical protein HRS9122_01048 [Pyrenophora teres f. teres]KAE8867714.1 hypothetical protein PTNB29_01625 [Pyrenophora teres f. teres]CAE7027215.1 hypothetical protein PTTW11_04208 [Pyrenophora teres f. teres]